MRSRHALSVLLALAPLVGCDSEDRRLADVCRKLRDCTDYVNEDVCKAQLGDAVEDRRVTPTELTRCAKCLSQSSQTCHDILDDRHCDVACHGVEFVLKAHTCGDRECEDSRSRGCDALIAPCGLMEMEVDDGRRCGPAGTCTSDLERVYCSPSTQEQVERDADVSSCLACVLTQRELTASSGAAGAGGAAAGQGGSAGLAQLPGAGSGAGGASTGGDSAGGRSPIPDGSRFTGVDLGRCTSLVAACSSACSKVDPIASRMRKAAAALVFCDRAVGCLDTSQMAGAGGEAGASASDGGAPASAPTVMAGMGGAMGGFGSNAADASAQRVECYRGVLAVAGASAQTLLDCADCAQASLDCDALVSSCKSCEALKQ
jgi:hypothetical protein